MKMSKKNKKAFDMGVSDRKEGILFERNPFQYMSLSPNSGWWQKGWKSENEILK